MLKDSHDGEDQSAENSKRKDSEKKKKLNLHIDTVKTNSTQKKPDQKEVTFTAADFSSLCENKHGRYVQNSKKIGHAVIMKKDDNTVAVQYALPAVADNQTPEVRPLMNIEAIEPFKGMHRYRAQTPDGKTAMYAKRFVFGKWGNENEEQPIQIACFSPVQKKGEQPFWGSIKETPIFREDLSKANHVTKGGDTLVVQHASVLQRDLIKTRTPAQNTVMGGSARDAYEHFFDRMAAKLHPEMKKRLKRAFKADIKDHFTKNYRPEWLHAKGWSLMPMGTDPQTEDNLGAGPTWANTQMMILESVVKWFAINAPESLLTIKPKFEMLLDSELIKHIDFNVKVKIKERFVELIQSIDPFQAYPSFTKASDVAQATAITHKILHEAPPASIQLIKNDNKSIKDDNQISLNTEQKPLALPSHQVDKKEELMVQERTHEQKTKNPHSKSQFPTAQKYERSVVEVYSDSFIPDYDNPWRDPESVSSSGSGFVIQDDSGKKYIITNAHVAENPIFLQVRLANDRHQKYEAKVKCISYQCDLALLEVEDGEFHEHAEPVDLGNMVNLHQKVLVVGFPMGGTEISVSKGIVSRIQVDSYSMSDQSLLQVQVDAAINPGNSGGPAFSDGKVIGVAFQGYSGHQGLGYIIPMPIVRHFLNEALSSKKYRGFPTLPITTEELENPHERAFYQLGHRTGIRIKKVDNLSDAFSKLKIDDILLSIDGLPISNEGTVDIPEIGNCIDYHHVTQSKFIGDKVTLKILRQGEELDVDVMLDNILGDSQKVSVPEHDKKATFYINSGISFVPLSRNFMEGEGSIFEDMYSVEDNSSLPDAPKKKPDDQIVVINKILKCKETQGYDKHTLTIVKEINGKSINNIHDVIVAMEDNKTSTHVITLASKSKIVVPNMPANQLEALLKRNYISHDRSPDLVPLVEEKPHHKKKQIIIESSSDEEEAKAASDVKGLDPKKVTFDDYIKYGKHVLPGLKHFNEKIDALEERYKNAPETDEVDEDENDEDYIDASDEETDDEEHSSQAEEENGEEAVTHASPIPSAKKSNHHRFFQPLSTSDIQIREKSLPSLHR